VTLNPSYKVYGTGAQFTVSVAINGASNVGSVPFHLVFDPSFVEFVGAPNASPFLSQDGTAVFVLTTLTAQKREVIVGLSRQGSRPGANGQGTLIEMTFRTLAKTGTTRIDFSDISVLDPQAQPLPFEKIGMDVVIQ
jgi:general secretion pathway protein D